MKILFAMPIHKRPFITRVSIEEGFEIIQMIEDQLGGDCEFRVYGDSSDPEIRAFSQQDNILKFIRVDNGTTAAERTNKFNEVYKDIHASDWDVMVWLDSNNLYSPEYKQLMLDAIRDRKELFGSVSYTMVSPFSKECRKFTAGRKRNVDTSTFIIGPGKGITREAWDKTLAVLYQNQGRFYSRNLRQRGKGYDADFVGWCKRYGVNPVVISKDPEDILDVKLGGDLNEVEKYTDRKARPSDLGEKCIAMIEKCLNDYGEGFEFPVELSDYVASLRG